MSLGCVQDRVLMTFFEDGTAYEYFPGQEPATNVGWLDEGHGYPMGPVPRAFVETLSGLCRVGVLPMRGVHYCDLCTPKRERRSYADLVSTVVQSSAGDYYVGNAEIRVPRSNGVPYAAPNMVIHYVVVHGYCPPEGFIEAVLSLDPSS